MVGVTAKVLVALRAFIAQSLEPMRYYALVRYRVVSVGVDKRLSLQIVRKALGYPDVLPIDVWPGLPGGHGEPALGAIVLVAFVEGNAGLPIVTHFSRLEDGAFLPVGVSLNASGTVRLGEDATEIAAGKALAPVVREGDIVTVGTASGAVVITTPLGAPPEKSRLKA